MSRKCSVNLSNGVIALAEALGIATDETDIPDYKLLEFIFSAENSFSSCFSHFYILVSSVFADQF